MWPSWCISFIVNFTLKGAQNCLFSVTFSKFSACEEECDAYFLGNTLSKKVHEFDSFSVLFSNFLQNEGGIFESDSSYIV